MAEPILAFRNLHIQARHGRSRVDLVRGISFTLARGEVMGLIGESGAGKSTLGLAALGHLRPGCIASGGQVLFRDTDLLRLPERRLRDIRGGRIAYVAQSAAAAFNPSHTLEAQIDEVLRRFGGGGTAQRRARIVGLFDRLGLPDPEHFGRRYPHQVSGGQLQRAMTAMALAPKPEIVVLDEPTTALDVTTQLGVLAAIRNAIRDEGSAALYISHDLAIVSQISDRVVVLRNGGIVEAGPTRRVVDTPREDYTRRLLAVGKSPVAIAPTASTDVILQATGLSAHHGRGAPTLQDVSLTLRRGTTLAVLGESGSGKSTLARVIAGLHPAAAGHVALEGRTLPPDLRRRDKDLLRRIQMIFQTPDTALNPAQTVREIVGRPLSLYFGARGAALLARIADLLRDVELAPELAARRPGALSGGQKQRVAIARALAADPDVLLCDEITASLDPLISEGVIALLDRLRRERGLSCLFITHDIGIVRSIADDVVVLQQGRIVDSGTSEAVMTRPRHAATRRLLDARPSTEPGWLDSMLAGMADRAVRAGRVETELPLDGVGSLVEPSLPIARN